MIGDRIKALRRKQGLNLIEFSKRVGVGRSQISRYETKEHIPIDRVIRRICKAFDIPVAWLCGYTDDITQRMPCSSAMISDARRADYRKIHGREQKSTYKTEQPCWECKHATNKYGKCSWAARLIPVKGWKAHAVSNASGMTWHIDSCPLYEEG